MSVLVSRAHTYTNQYHLHSFFPDGCLPVLTVLRVSHQERRSVSVTGRCGVVCVVRARAYTPTAIMNKPLHPVTREADMEVPFLLKEMLS